MNHQNTFQEIFNGFNSKLDSHLSSNFGIVNIKKDELNKLKEKCFKEVLNGEFFITLPLNFTIIKGYYQMFLLASTAMLARNASHDDYEEFITNAMNVAKSLTLYNERCIPNAVLKMKLDGTLVAIYQPDVF